MTRTCNICEYNDGKVYTSFPPQMRCTITGEFHLHDHPCDVEFEPVVRCKECIYRNDDKMCEYKTYWVVAQDDNDFCSWGKKEDGHTER